MKLLFIAISFFTLSVFAQDLSESERNQAKLNEQMWNALRSHDNAGLAKAIDAGAQPNKRDAGDQIPIYWAISKKEWKSALVLIEKGASPCVGTANISPLLVATEADPKLWEGVSEEKKSELLGMNNLTGYRKVCRSSTAGAATAAPSSNNTGR